MRPCPTSAAGDIAVFGLNFFWRLQGPLIRVCDNDTSNKFIVGVVVRVCEVSMDAPFHGGSNDTIGGREYRCPFTAASLFLPSGSQLCRKNRPLSSKQFIAGVNDTGDTFSPGVVNTG